MLFPYVSARHRMRAMQSFVAFIFAKVWCRAPANQYSIDLFSGLPSLYAIMEQLDREDKAGKDSGAGAFFYRHVNEIFNHFKMLSTQEIASYLSMFKSNNNIRALCEGRRIPTRYPAGACSPMMKKIRSFFSKLYRSGFFNLEIVKQHVGAHLHDHYRDFMKINTVPCCPFCGLLPMDNEHDLTREAYDHYLPASVYPFNSVNLKNLAPACYKCNSQYKGAKDPLIGADGQPRRAFYPYALTIPKIEISISFRHAHQIPTSLEDIEITVSADGFEEEVSTWDSLYRIRERYAAKCCGDSGGKHWMNRILHECKNYEKSPREMLNAELLACGNSPWVEASFLQAEFLREADRGGLV